MKKERLLQGLTQIQLAKRAGVSQSVITKIERNTIDPTFSIVQKISLALTHSQKVAKNFMQTRITYSTKDTHSDIALMRKLAVSQLVVGVGKVITEKDILSGKKFSEVPCVPADFAIEAVRQLLQIVPVVLVVEHEEVKCIISRSDLLDLV